MVKPIRVLALAAAALACLAGCDPSTGIFPGRLMSYEAYADLAGYIDHDRVWDFTFQIIRDSRPGSGYPEYLVLVNDDRSFDGVHLAVYDADLKMLGKFTIEQLDAMNTGAPFEGRGAMMDASGAIVVGNRRFSVEPRGLAYASTPPTLGTLGLAIPGPPDFNIENIRGEGMVLKYRRYQGDWLDLGESMPQFVPAGSGYKVYGAWLTDAFVILAVTHDSPPRQIFLLDRTLFRDGTLCAPLDPGCLPSEVHNVNPSFSDFVEWQTLGYYNDGTEEGFAAFRRDSKMYFRFDRNGNEVPDSTFDPEKEPWDQRHVYGRTSGWYIFDMKEMSIQRRAWWWK